MSKLLNRAAPPSCDEQVASLPEPASFVAPVLAFIDHVHGLHELADSLAVGCGRSTATEVAFAQWWTEVKALLGVFAENCTHHHDRCGARRAMEDLLDGWIGDGAREVVDSVVAVRVQRILEGVAAA